MIIATSADGVRSRQQRMLENGTEYFKSTYITPEMSDGDSGPVCNLIEQFPKSIIWPHFHKDNQFQVVVAGSGTLGRHQVALLVVHYAAAHTTYGPITSDDEGLHYFTLRDGFDPAAYWMPDSRTKLVPGARRHVISTVVRSASAEELASRSEHHRQVVLKKTEDGPASWLLRLGPGGTATGDDPATGDGQFWLLIRGDASVGDEALTPYSCVYVSPDDPALEVTAGPDGAEILAMQFPRKARHRPA